jgi:hypothetical protein
MSLITTRLYILKDEIALSNEKNPNKFQIIQRVKSWQVWVPVVFHWKKPELGQGGKP